jgi:Ca2+-binding RTX toxin-like protein
MAVTNQSVTVRSADPSTSPAQVVADADSVAGITGSLQKGIDVSTGFGDVPGFGFAGAFSPVDDAVYVPTAINNIGATSAWMPGQTYSLGFMNEKRLAEGGPDKERNYTVQNRPNDVTPDVASVMGL